MNAEEIWKKALINIKKNIKSQISYDVHIKTAGPVRFDDPYFIISVPTSINKNIIEHRFINLIEASVEIASGEKIPVRIAVGDDDPEIDLMDIRLGDDILLGSDVPIGGMSPKYTFDNFIVGSSNEFASAAAKTVSEVPGTIYNPLFIYGKSGLGKTHLMQAIGNKTKELHPEMNVLYVTGEKFTTDFIRSVRENTTHEFTEKYRTPDVLLVDDVQFIENKEATQEEFFHTFNELFNNNKQIVLTSDRKPSDLTTLTDRLRTRFSQGLIIDISVPNFETRVAILQNKAIDYGVTIDDEILSFIAENARSNIRELEGVLNSVISKSQFEGCELTLDFVKSTIGKIIVTDSVKITPKRIIERTAFYYKISENDIMGKIKTKEIAVPRQVAMYLCRKLLSLSDTQIGREFDKDRSTVSSNISKIEASLLTDNSLNSDIDYITKDIESK